MRTIPMGPYDPLDGNTILKFKPLGFLIPNKKNSKRKALAFNQDRCCHAALCLQLILSQLKPEMEATRVTRRLLKTFAKVFKKLPKTLPSQKRPKYLKQSSI
jgi:hypothetical protein